MFVGDGIPINIMSAWDIDDEESPEHGGRGGRVGAEHYSIVVHYKEAKVRHIIPHHVKRNERGEAVKSTYNKAMYQTEEGTPDTVRVDKVEKWTTKKDILDNMSSEAKQACNAIKTFLMKSICLIWYHNGNEDECSQFGGHHWHIVIQSEIGANGNYKYLHDVSAFRNMKTKVKNANGYVKVQLCRNVIAIIRHFNCKPRVFIGSNKLSIYKRWKEACELGHYEGPIDEFVEPDDGDDNIDIQGEKRYCTWDDEEPEAKKGGWECDEDMFVLPRNSERTIVVKETSGDQIGRLLKVLMKRYRANNMSEMFNAIGRLPQGVDQSYVDLWHRLAARGSTSKLMESTLNFLKCENMKKTFNQMVEEFCKTPDYLNPERYETPQSSYKFFIQWCKKQHIDVGAFITELMDVLNKVHPKINTFCLIGPSNAGKNCMFSDPLVHIFRYVGQIGNRGNDSAFMWQECINCSLVRIDECIMAPDHYEDLKLIMGGETMKVHVKFQAHATIYRTPVIMTGNKDPWVLNFAAKDAMMNRMHLYRVETDEDLKDIKLMHPGMWWYLMQQYGQLIKLKPFTRLEPYPEVVDQDVIDPTDPLD